MRMRIDPRSRRECQSGRPIYATSCLAAAEIITSLPVITATSRIAVWMCTGICSTKTFEEGTADRDPVDQQRKGEHLRRHRTGEAEHGDLDEAGAERDHRIGRDHAAPSSPAAISSDSRITPEPKVPPTSTP